MKLKFAHLGLVVLTVMAISCQPKENKEKQKPGKAENKEFSEEVDTNIYTVKTIKVGYSTVDKTEEYTANIKAWEEANIGPAMSGQIEKIYVEPGDRVKKGDLLAMMDQSQLIQTKIQFEDAKKDFERMDTLINYGSISQQTYDKAKMGYELAKSALKTLDENVNLYAPFDGIITGKYNNEGEMYSSMSPNMETGVACLLSIMKINVLKTFLNVSEKYWPVVTKNMNVTITTDIYHDKIFKGSVSNVYPTINSSSKTFKVEVKIPNKDEELRPGMFAKAKLYFGEKETLTIPVISVLKQDGTNERFVFVEKDNKAVKRFVQIGKRYDDMIEIISGINVGENVIVAGQAKLMEGNSVKIIK